MGLIEPVPPQPTTTLRIALDVPGLEGLSLLTGTWRFTPSRRLVAADRIIAPRAICVAPNADEVASGFFLVDLLASDTDDYGPPWGWTAAEPRPGITRTVIVPSESGIVEYAALPTVDPATLEPEAPLAPGVVALLRDLARRQADAEARLIALGQSVPNAITDTDSGVDTYLSGFLGATLGEYL